MFQYFFDQNPSSKSLWLLQPLETPIPHQLDLQPTKDSRTQKSLLVVLLRDLEVGLGGCTL